MKAGCDFIHFSFFSEESSSYKNVFVPWEMLLKTGKALPRWILPANGAELPFQLQEMPGSEFWELEEGLNGTFRYAFRDDNFKL